MCHFHDHAAESELCRGHKVGKFSDLREQNDLGKQIGSEAQSG